MTLAPTRDASIGAWLAETTICGSSTAWPQAGAIPSPATRADAKTTPRAVRPSFARKEAFDMTCLRHVRGSNESRRRGPRDAHLVWQTKIRVEPRPQSPRRLACHRCGNAAPYARPARRKGDRAGRSPGLRVVTLAPPSQAVWPSGIGRRARRRQLRGQLRIWRAGLHAAPDSLLAGRSRHTCTGFQDGVADRPLSTRGVRVPGAAQHVGSPSRTCAMGCPEVVRCRPGTQIECTRRNLDPGSAAQR